MHYTGSSQVIDKLDIAPWQCNSPSPLNHFMSQRFVMRWGGLDNCFQWNVFKLLNGIFSWGKYVDMHFENFYIWCQYEQLNKRFEELKRCNHGINFKLCNLSEGWRKV